jgi:N-acetylneuraminic acid mutarotase
VVLPLVVGMLAAACTTPGPDPRTDGSATPADDTTRQRRAADLPEPRPEVTGAVWDGRIVVAGGLDAQGSAVSNVDIYDPTTDAWSRGPDLPVALHHTAMATLDDRVYVVGGYVSGGRAWVPQAAVWSIGPGEDEWRTAPPLTSPRGALAVAATEDRLVAVGGVGPNEQVLTSTEELESAAERWVPGPELATAREHLAAVAVGGEVYAIAGRAGGLESNHDSVEVLRDGTWQNAPALSFARGGVGAATVDGIACVVGGEEPEGTIGSIECLTEGSWEVIGELDVPRHGLAVTVFDGALHVIGGGPEPGLTISGVHEVLPLGMGAAPPG